MNSLTKKKTEKKIPNTFTFYSSTVLFCCVFLLYATSLIPVDYGTDSDDDDQHGNDDSNKTDAENAATNSLQQNNVNNGSNIEPSEIIPNVPANTVTEQLENNEILPTPEIPPPTVPNQNEIAPTISVEPSCDLDNGGCEQTCTMIPDEEIGGNVAECSCRIGFYLDSDVGKKCLGMFLSIYFFLKSLT